MSTATMEISIKLLKGKKKKQPTAAPYDAVT